jgi:addiction module HigA family antidote
MTARIKWIWKIIIEGGLIMERKMPPVHPGRLVGSALDHLSLGVTEASDILGVSRQHLHRVLKGTASITPTLAVKIGKLFGNGARLWLNMQARYDAAQAEIDLAEDIALIPTMRVEDRVTV